MTPSEILNKAADLLEQPGKWIQGCEAKDKNNFACSPHSDTACKFCVIGALESLCIRTRTSDMVFDIATTHLRSYLIQTTKFEFGSIAGYNDDSSRTQEQVVKMLRAAANN